MNVLYSRKLAFIEKFGDNYPDLSEILVRAALGDAQTLASPNTVNMQKLETMLPPMHAWASEEERNEPPRVLANPFDDSAGAMEEVGSSPYSPKAIWPRLLQPKKRPQFCHGNVDLTPPEYANQLLVDDFFETAELRCSHIIPRDKSGEFNSTVFTLIIGAYIAGDTIYK